jgi:phosphoribosylformimino-5-aminoimidazole carboxamide ribotide isomerase
MTFEIIPSIDIRGGQCVRLLQGNYNEETVYGNDPVAMAKRWQDEGGTRLHVVDLDGARDGVPANIEALNRLRASFRFLCKWAVACAAATRFNEYSMRACSAASSVRRRRHVPNGRSRCSRNFGNAVILGIDARDGIVATAGWQESSGIPAVHFAQAMQNAGCARIIFTDIARDGTLAGPNAAALREIAEAVEIPSLPAAACTKRPTCAFCATFPM